MIPEEFCIDLKFLLVHMHKEPDKAIKRWSSASCTDFQAPIALISGFLLNALILYNPMQLNLRDKPEFIAVAEIVEKSQLRSLLEVDRSTNSIRFRAETPESVIREVSEFVLANTSGCV